MPVRKPLAIIMGNSNSSHLTKAEIEERMELEIKAPNDKIEPPSYLPKPLQDKFNEIANELIDVGIMSNLDCESLARFITSEYQYQKVVVKALKMSPDNEKYVGLLLMQEKLFKMARTSAGDLGLTISSRCKLITPNVKKEEDPLKSRFGDI